MMYAACKFCTASMTTFLVNAGVFVAATFTLLACCTIAMRCTLAMTPRVLGTLCVPLYLVVPRVRRDTSFLDNSCSICHDQLLRVCAPTSETAD